VRRKKNWSFFVCLWRTWRSNARMTKSAYASKRGECEQRVLWSMIQKGLAGPQMLMMSCVKHKRLLPYLCVRARFSLPLCVRIILPAHVDASDELWEAHAQLLHWFSTFSTQQLQQRNMIKVYYIQQYRVVKYWKYTSAPLPVHLYTQPPPYSLAFQHTILRPTICHLIIMT
jgi:hypothetical protein